MKLMLISKFDLDMFNDEFIESKGKALVQHLYTITQYFRMKKNQKN